MNIQFQVCGLLICLVLMILYMSKKSLGLYSERLFLRIMIGVSILLISDIVSVVVIRQQEVIPLLIVKAICKFYTFWIIIVSGMAVDYVFCDLLPESIHRKFSRICGLYVGLSLIVVSALPINVYNDGISIYTYGPSIGSVYVFAALNIVATLFIAVFNKKRMYSRRRFAIIVWMLVWLASAGVQFVFNELLLVGFSAAIGIIILYIVLENPEANINRTLGCFNSFAFEKYVNQLFERKEKFHVISFYLEEIGSNTQKNDFLDMLMDKESQYKDLFIFKELNMDFFIVTQNDEEYGRLKSWILEENKKEEGNFLKDVFVQFVDDGLMLENFDNLEEIFLFVKSDHIGKSIGGTVIIDNEVIQNYGLQRGMQEVILNALDEDRVEVFFQPIFSTKEEKFVSAEALVRIREKDSSLVSPGLFIPVAEKTGLINELGERIFEKVCIFLHDYEPWQYGLEYVEVNLSVVQCEQENLADIIIEKVEKYGIEPKRINLEITETATLNAKKRLLKNMDRLIEKGFSFSLDDFGKGESNLMYIVEMPVAIVKLDYDMTKAFFRMPKAKNVVKSVVKMAHDMGLHLVSEGIESREEVESMTEEEIDYIQGYYFSKPVPVSEFIELLKEKNKDKY